METIIKAQEMNKAIKLLREAIAELEWQAKLCMRDDKPDRVIHLNMKIAEIRNIIVDLSSSNN